MINELLLVALDRAMEIRDKRIENLLRAALTQDAIPIDLEQKHYIFRVWGEERKWFLYGVNESGHELILQFSEVHG